MPKVKESPRIPLSSLGSFPSRWQEKTLSEACRLVTDGTHDSPKESDSGFPLITGKCITEGRIDFSKAYLISKEDHLQVIARSKPELGDVLFANIGNSIGDLASVDTEAEFSIKNVALFKPGSDLDARFLKFWLACPLFQDYVKNSTFGSAQPFIGLNTLRSLPIPIPPLIEQKAIGEVLGALDDKIELNRKMNETLEQIARAIFKSWFIDFDPVHAKRKDERLFGVDDVTARLFPNSFEESELGEIPKGWRTTSLTEIVSLIGGGTPKTSIDDYWNGSIPWFSVVDTPKGSDVWVLDTQKHISESGLDNCSARLLRPGTTIISARGTVGNLALVGTEMAMNQSCYGVVGKEGYTDAFVYFALKNLVNHLRQHAHGSVFDTITRDTFSNSYIAVPSIDKRLVKAFEERVTPLLSMIKNNVAESHSLALARDLLLPRLLSGELSIKGATS